jgi:hypothetical protein
LHFRVAKSPLIRTVSLDESGISTGDDIGMRYEFHAHDIGGFMTAPGVPQGKFSPSRWEDEEMSGITLTTEGCCSGFALPAKAARADLNPIGR